MISPISPVGIHVAVVVSTAAAVAVTFWLILRRDTAPDALPAGTRKAGTAVFAAMAMLGTGTLGFHIGEHVATKNVMTAVKLLEFEADRHKATAEAAEQLYRAERERADKLAQRLQSGSDDKDEPPPLWNPD